MAYEDAADFTLQWYNRLPELYRTADATEPSGGGQPLLRFLDLLGQQAGEVETLAAAVTTDLADPQLAASEWLPWLAQMVGVRLPVGYTDELARDLISAGAGWLAGTPEAIAAAVRSVLTDDGNPPYVQVVADPVTPWTINLTVADSQAPTPLSLVTDAIERAQARPAGFVINVTDFYTAPWSEFDGATWAEVEATGPDWEDVDTADLP